MINMALKSGRKHRQSSIFVQDFFNNIQNVSNSNCVMVNDLNWSCQQQIQHFKNETCEAQPEVVISSNDQSLLRNDRKRKRKMISSTSAKSDSSHVLIDFTSDDEITKITKNNANVPVVNLASDDETDDVVEVTSVEKRQSLVLIPTISKRNTSDKVCQCSWKERRFLAKKKSTCILCLKYVTSDDQMMPVFDFASAAQNEMRKP